MQSKTKLLRAVAPAADHDDVAGDSIRKIHLRDQARPPTRRGDRRPGDGIALPLGGALAVSAPRAGERRTVAASLPAMASTHAARARPAARAGRVAACRGRSVALAVPRSRSCRARRGVSGATAEATDRNASEFGFCARIQANTRREAVNRCYRCSWEPGEAPQRQPLPGVGDSPAARLAPTAIDPGARPSLWCGRLAPAKRSPSCQSIRPVGCGHQPPRHSGS
jgi:hypothetical protein